MNYKTICHAIMLAALVVTPANAMYSSAEVKPAVDGQLDNNIKSIQTALKLAQAGEWDLAAYALLHGSKQVPNRMWLYLEYFPETIHYAASSLGQLVPFPQREQLFPGKRLLQSLLGQKPQSPSSDIKPALDWQFLNDRISVEMAVRYAQYERWHEAARSLVSGQKQSPDKMIMYLYYFPEAIKYAAYLTGETLRAPDDPPPPETPAATPKLASPPETPAALPKLPPPPETPAATPKLPPPPETPAAMPKLASPPVTPAATPKLPPLVCVRDSETKQIHCGELIP